VNYNNISFTLKIINTSNNIFRNYIITSDNIIKESYIVIDYSYKSINDSNVFVYIK
jgi:hypothetical protein